MERKRETRTASAKGCTETTGTQTTTTEAATISTEKALIVTYKQTAVLGPAPILGN